MKQLLVRILGVIAASIVLSSTAHATNCNPFSFTLTNGQTADANQVMSNFNNLLNCSNNNLAHNGANSDITSMSGLSTPLSVSQGGLAGTTIPLNALITGNGGSAPLFIAAPATNGFALIATNSVWVPTAPSASFFPNSTTVQVLTSTATSTYTLPTNPSPRQLYVKECGGGGGGSGTQVNVGPNGSGGNGGQTNFNGIFAGGGGGAPTTAGGAGGTNGGGFTGVTRRMVGNGGFAGGLVSGTGTGNAPAGTAGPWGGAPAGTSAASTNGANAAVNTCAGGAAAWTTGVNNAAGNSGGAGEYVEILINNPPATITYANGTAGSAGGGVSNNGGTGGTGVIIVEERY